MKLKKLWHETALCTQYLAAGTFGAVAAHATIGLFVTGFNVGVVASMTLPFVAGMALIATPGAVALGVYCLTINLIGAGLAGGLLLKARSALGFAQKHRIKSQQLSRG